MIKEFFFQYRNFTIEYPRPPFGHFGKDFTKRLYIYQYLPPSAQSRPPPFEFLCTPLYVAMSIWLILVWVLADQQNAIIILVGVAFKLLFPVPLRTPRRTIHFKNFFTKLLRVERKRERVREREREREQIF